jgi:excinuclease ABC subunit C
VGKARNLKKRVSSYFQKDHGGTRIGHMVSRIARMETTVVRSEAEALLLENNLIKTLNPKFNILFRDDKSYPYLKLAAPWRRARSRAWPTTVGAVDRKHRYFGPYPSAWAVKETIQLLQKAFSCAPAKTRCYANRSRPCLLYQIRRCSGPCVGLITPEDYGRDVSNAERFLLGATDEVIGTLQTQMMAYADALEFERAAEVRNQISALSRVLHQQSMEESSLTSVRDRDVDVLAVQVQGGRACVNLAMVRGGRHLGDRAYFPGPCGRRRRCADRRRGRGTQQRADGPEQQVLEAFIAQHYLGVAPPGPAGAELPGGAGAAGRAGRADRQQDQRPAPAAGAAQAVAGDGREGRADRAGASAVGRRQPARAHPCPGGGAGPGGRGHRRSCASSASTSATPRARRRRPAAWSMKAMQDAPGRLPPLQHRRHHRRRRLRRHAPGADPALCQGGRGAAASPRRPASMGPMAPTPCCPRSLRLPDLVLVDGGRGQVAMAREVFTGLGLDLALIVGVEKGEGRKVGLEELVFADGREKVYLGHDSAALMLVAQIRDEAHRFAITGMRAKRASVRTGGSKLEDIPGVGPKKRAAAAALWRRARRQQCRRRRPGQRGRHLA